MKDYKITKKALSILLCLCMVLSWVPIPTHAAETDTCTHHLEHTADCGYAEAVAGQDCAHKHSEDCYAILECLHTCTEDCDDPCTHECTVDNGCITMELDCHHTHGDCGYSDGTAEVPCGHVHSESCGYAQALAGSPCANAGTDPECDHSGDCGYVAAVEGAPCGHTACDDTCGYAPATEGTPCTHTHAVKVNSADSCYKLLCSHKDGGHDETCGYAAAVEAHECQYECAQCVEEDLSSRTSPQTGVAIPEGDAEDQEIATSAPDGDLLAMTEDVCNCGTDDETIHATTCAVYVAPENPVCCCAEKCTEVNVWCDVCGFDYTACTGTDTAAAYDAATYDLWVGGVQFTSANLVIDSTDDSTITGTATYDPDTNTLTLNNFNYTGPGYTDMAAAIYYGGANELNLTLEGDSTVTQNAPKLIGMGFHSHGVYVVSGLIVSGNGSLTAVGGTGNALSENNQIYYGVVVESYITVESGTLTGTGGNVSTSDVTGMSYGVYALGDITIKGGTLTSTGGSVSASNYAYSYGVVALGYGIVVESGTLTGTSGTVSASTYESYGVVAGNSITLSGGVTVAKGDTQAFYKSPDTTNFASGLVWYGESDTAYTGTGTLISNADTYHTNKYVRIAPCDHGGETPTYSNGVCTVCGTRCNHTDAPTYTPTADGSQHTATYDCCGATVTENHTGGTATCTGGAICEACGAKYGSEDYYNHAGPYTAKFNWNEPDEDGCFVYAELYCDCGGLVDFYDGYAELTASEEAKDCKTPGTATYSITFTLNGDEYTDTNTFELKSENHPGFDSDGFCTLCGGYQPAVDTDEDGVYEISNAGQLYWYAQQLNEKNEGIHGKLTKDIEIPESAPNWVPINASYAYFDGDYHTISGLTCIGDENMPYVGLIGRVWWFDISNLHITNSYFEGSEYVGAVVASTNAGGSMTNCIVTNTTVKGGNYVGALVGYLDLGEVSNCYTDGSVAIGRDWGDGTVTNVYYLSDTDDGNGGKTAEQFASGEVAWLLQSGIQGEVVDYDQDWNPIYGEPAHVWGQTIDSEDYPVFGGKKVYRIDNTGCLSYGAYTYTNDEDTVYAPDHNFPEGSNGFCACGNGFQPCEGEGTEDIPYKIANAGNLYWFAAVVNGGYGGVAKNRSAHGKLTANIVVNQNVLNADGAPNGTPAYTWTPIGNSSNQYTGTFDGADHTISGLYFNNSSTSYVGLFGCVGSGGKVQNVGVIGSYFYGSQYVGGVVGWNIYGTVKNCYNEGTVSGSSAHIGGVVGISYSTVTNCYNTGTVSGSDRVGGVVGCISSDGTVTNCYNEGTVSGSSNVGGVVGYITSSGTVTNCYNEGSVSGSGSCVGGVAGYISSSGTVTNCYYLTGCAVDGNGTTQNGIGASSKGSTTADADGSTAAKTSDEFTSGAVAYLLQGDQTEQVWGQNLDNDKTVDTAPNFTGAKVYQCTACTGKAAYTNDSDLSGKAVGHSYVNGICKICGLDENGVYHIYTAEQLMAFAAAVNAGNTTANAILEADIDLSNYTWITICETGLYYNAYGEDLGYAGTFDGNGHIIKNITVTSSTTRAASCGLFGTVSGTIKNLGIEGFTFVDGGYDIRAGAIVGQLITADGKVSNCYVKGATINPGEHVVGGIAGCVYDGTIENCYVVESTISGTSGRFGHIVGDSRGDGGASDRPGTVTNCYTDNATIRSNNVGNVTNCVTKDAAAFESGEVTYLLNSGVTDGTQVWYQTLTGDDAQSYPQFKGGTVYSKSESCCEGYTNTLITHEFNNNGICTVCSAKQPATLNGDVYEIYNVGQHMWFADYANNSNTSANAKLMADIDLTDYYETYGNLMIGTSSAKYSGTFDGNGKTLTVNLNSTEQYLAPFRYINGATIQNLTVNGTITIGEKFAGGLVGYSEGNSKIEKCFVGVTINSTVSGDGTHGGLVANVNSGTMTINNCAFVGTISGSSTTSCGGFVGWSNGTTTISNSYVAGIFETNTDGCYTFGRNPSKITVIKSYYQTAYGTVNSDAIQKSEEQFKSGEVTYLLNGSKSNDGVVWKQTLEEDDYPVFDGSTVYASSPCPAYFSNTETTQNHDYGEDTVCTLCGDVFISVTITWTAMEFTYTSGEWDPETHTYAEGSWVPDNDGNGVITVTNHNKAVYVGLSYTGIVSGVSGSFDVANDALAAGGTASYTLSLTGRPDGAHFTDQTLGTVTVTISNTPNTSAWSVGDQVEYIAIDGNIYEATVGEVTADKVVLIGNTVNMAKYTHDKWTDGTVRSLLSSVGARYPSTTEATAAYYRERTDEKARYPGSNPNYCRVAVYSNSGSLRYRYLDTDDSQWMLMARSFWASFNDRTAYLYYCYIWDVPLTE